MKSQDEHGISCARTLARTFTASCCSGPRRTASSFWNTLRFVTGTAVKEVSVRPETFAQTLTWRGLDNASAFLLVYAVIERVLRRRAKPSAPTPRPKIASAAGSGAVVGTKFTVTEPSPLRCLRTAEAHLHQADVERAAPDLAADLKLKSWVTSRPLAEANLANAALTDRIVAFAFGRPPAARLWLGGARHRAGRVSSFTPITNADPHSGLDPAPTFG